jgi:hypothetical protein
LRRRLFPCWHLRLLRSTILFLIPGLGLLDRICGLESASTATAYDEAGAEDDEGDGDSD